MFQRILPTTLPVTIRTWSQTCAPWLLAWAIVVGHRGAIHADESVWEDAAGGMSVALLVDQTAKDTVYAGTSSGGVFKSMDAGRTWRNASTGLPGSWINALAIEPGSPAGTLYAGTHREGIFRSRDAAGTWTAANAGLGTLAIHALAVDDRTSPSTVYAGTARGLFKSSDHGDSWSLVHKDLAAPSTRALAVDRSTKPATLYAGTNKGLFRSADGGTSWTKLSPGPDRETKPISAIELAVDSANPRTIYAASGGEVFKTEDGGGSWRSVLKVGYPRSLMIDAGKAPAKVFVGTAYRSVLSSVDGGVTWKETAAGLPRYAEVFALALDARTRTIYAATSHVGVFRTTDGGQHWQGDDSRRRRPQKAKP